MLDVGHAPTEHASAHGPSGTRATEHAPAYGPATPRATVASLEADLRAADRALARAVASLAELGPAGAIAAETHLPEELALRLRSRRTSWDARELMAMAEATARMPALGQALSEGLVSFSQARAIVRAVRPLAAAGRARVDALVARRAPRLVRAEPEQLVREVEDEVCDLLAAREVARERRAERESFLSLQQDLEGGGRLYGQVDALRFATICEAIDAAAERPQADDDEDEDFELRARQRMDALVGICSGYLAGDGTGAARPSVILTAELSETGLAGAARILTRVMGRPPRLSPIATEQLLDEADLTAVLFEQGRPIAVSDTVRRPPEKIRTAVAARDGGCRFPGCTAPVAWCDCHHLRGRRGPRAHHPDHLAMQCRRHHRLVHEQGWQIAPCDDGALAFSLGEQTFISYPRARPLRE